MRAGSCLCWIDDLCVVVAEVTDAAQQGVLSEDVKMLVLDEAAVKADVRSILLVKE